MLGLSAPAIGPVAVSHPLAQAAAPLISPALLVGLCALAAIGTILLLPSPRRDRSVRAIGGTILAATAAVLGLILINTARQVGQGQMGVYFWVFSAIALTAAIRVVTHTQPVYSALYFVLTVLASAGLFVLLHADFMAAALVLIYAGAILVTYVFVIMLATQATAGGPAEHDRVSREPVAASAMAFVLLGLILSTVMDAAAAAQVVPYAGAPSPAASIAAAGPTQALGVHLFEQHLLSLELAGLILTLAMAGAIVIARREVYSPRAAEAAAEAAAPGEPGEPVAAPATPSDDNPHSIPVYGTDNPRQKAYPQA